MSIELTDEQKELKRKLIHWYHHYGTGKPYFYYSGAAGTGKTTVMKSMIDDLGLKDNEVIACAYVGKAVLVLMRHGLNASTIHSFAYMPRFVTENEIEFDDFGNPVKKAKKKLEFVLRPSVSKDLKLIFLDERSMINDKMLNDLLSFGIPIVMAGDMNQLEPVFGSATDMDTPDFILTKIMRQAEDDPIVWLSQCILNDTPIDYGTYGRSRVLRSVNFGSNLLKDYDIILCAKNKTRDDFNNRIREELLGYTSPKPMLGEKMICRKNDWSEYLNGIYLTNGLVGYVRDINYCSLHRDIVYMNFQPDFMEESFEKLKVDYKFLKADWKERKNFGFSDMSRFEYAYAITTHLSQGSEYSRVLFMDEPFGKRDTQKRLRYTAITRAKDAIDYIKLEEPKKVYYTFGNYQYSV